MTRLCFMLSVFLGIQFATESLGGLKEMVTGHLYVFCLGRTVLLNLAAGVEGALDLRTHHTFAGGAGLLGAVRGHVHPDGHLLGDPAREPQAGLSQARDV